MTCACSLAVTLRYDLRPPELGSGIIRLGSDLWTLRS
jgi:hypothetical protein